MTTAKGPVTIRENSTAGTPTSTVSGSASPRASPTGMKSQPTCGLIANRAGSEYWGGLLSWIRSTLIESATISADDVELFRLTDDVDEVVAVIQEAAAARQAEGTPGGGMRSLPMPSGPVDA